MAEFFIRDRAGRACGWICFVLCWAASIEPCFGAMMLSDALTDGEASSLGLSTYHLQWNGGVHTSPARAKVSGQYYVRGYASGSNVFHWFRVGSSTYNAMPDTFVWLSPSTAQALPSSNVRSYLGADALASYNRQWADGMTGYRKRETFDGGYFVLAFASTVGQARWYQTNQETYDAYGTDYFGLNDVQPFNNGVHAVTGDTVKPMAMLFSGPGAGSRLLVPALQSNGMPDFISGVCDLVTHYFGYFISGVCILFLYFRIAEWFNTTFAEPAKVSKREARMRDAAYAEDEWRSEVKAEKAEKEWRRANVRSWGTE